MRISEKGLSDILTGIFLIVASFPATRFWVWIFHSIVSNHTMSRLAGAYWFVLTIIAALLFIIVGFVRIIRFEGPYADMTLSKKGVSEVLTGFMIFFIFLAAFYALGIIPRTFANSTIFMGFIRVCFLLTLLLAFYLILKGLIGILGNILSDELETTGFKTHLRSTMRRTSMFVLRFSAVLAIFALIMGSIPWEFLYPSGLSIHAESNQIVRSTFLDLFCKLIGKYNLYTVNCRIVPHPDAGKVCTDSVQCLGDCAILRPQGSGARDIVKSTHCDIRGQCWGNCTRYPQQDRYVWIRVSNGSLPARW